MVKCQWDKQSDQPDGCSRYLCRQCHMLARNCGDHENDKLLLDKMPDCQPRAGAKKIPLAALKAASAPSRGFGDTIAKITKAAGIKPCGGCKKRQEALNRLFPYRDKGG
jgi:hypothetical protein